MRRRSTVRGRWAVFGERLESIPSDGLTVGALLWALEAAGPIRVTMDEDHRRFGIVPVYGREVPEDLLPDSVYFPARTRLATLHRQEASEELLDQAEAMRAEGRPWKEISAALDRNSDYLAKRLRARKKEAVSRRPDETS